MNEDFESFDVVIGGGSFVGLGLALALSCGGKRREAAGLKIAVVDRGPLDRSEASKNDGRAFSLSSASVSMLDVLGVWDELVQFAQPITDIEITDSTLNALDKPVFLEIRNLLDGGDAASFMVESAVLLDALLDALVREGRVRLLGCDQIERFEADDQAVQIWLASGQRLSADLLVAADGRGSLLRKLGGIKTVGWGYDQTGLVATVAHEKPHEGRAVQHFLSSGPFAILPLSGDRSSLVWTEETEFAATVMLLDDGAFLEHVRERFGSRLGELSLAGPRGGFPLALQIARSFKAKRFALVGDAAHAVHPLAGQGLNIAFRDVAALAESIVDALRLGLDIGSETVLTRYERWRRFDSATSAFAMDGINRLFSNDVPPVRVVRDFGLRVVNRSPTLKNFFVKEAAGLTGEVPRLLKGLPV